MWIIIHQTRDFFQSKRCDFINVSFARYSLFTFSDARYCTKTTDILSEEPRSDRFPARNKSFSIMVGTAALQDVRCNLGRRLYPGPCKILGEPSRASWYVRTLQWAKTLNWYSPAAVPGQSSAEFRIWTTHGTYATLS